MSKLSLKAKNFAERAHKDQVANILVSHIQFICERLQASVLKLVVATRL